jgi:hypothetical protein
VDGGLDVSEIRPRLCVHRCRHVLHSVELIVTVMTEGDVRFFTELEFLYTQWLHTRAAYVQGSPKEDGWSNEELDE